MARKTLCILLATLLLTLCLAAFGACKNRNKVDPTDGLEVSDVVNYAASVRQGYAVEYLGEVERSLPDIRNEGLECGYPTYGSTKSLTTEQKEAILAENKLLCGKATSNTGGSYDKIDKNGKLYVLNGTEMTPFTNDDGSQRTLYKHSAAVGMYGGNLSDSEKAVVKRITFQPRGYSSYSVTGLYAPAGEVVAIEMSEEDFAATGGVTIHIGQALYNGQANNIWSAKSFNRMPVILNTLLFNANTAEYDEQTHTYTCYVGSYFGGPIYIRNTSVAVTLTISGAVNYRHLVYGLTTKEEFEELSKSTAPYFDLEVWHFGVLMSGAVGQVKNFSYENLLKSADLWDKISSISTQVRKQGIVFIFDPFVAAGAAVAFPGRSSVNCPLGWMSNALNYDSFVRSGSWGNVHEYNHNFQGWGLSGGGEVTNNALNLVAYAQNTNISASRTMTASGESGLSGCNAYTMASWVLKQVNAGAYEGTSQLSIYATLLHNLGGENFLAATNVSGTTNYYNRLCAVTGYDMTYFFRNMLNLDPGDEAVSAIEAQNLPNFVPVGCVYQTGRSILTPSGDTAYIKTMRPYRITYGEKFQLNLSPYTLENGMYKSGTIVLPTGFSYVIKSVSAPASGSLKRESDYLYTYTPGKEMTSGEIKVTLQITKDDDPSFKVDDIDLVIELEQTHENNKSVLERTVYTFDAETFANYATAADAFEADFAGYASMETENNVNPTQNSNTDIWVPNPSSNAFMVVSGKLLVSENGDYRIALRGRHSVALFVSTDGGSTYFKAADITHNTNKNDWWTTANGYYDLNNLTAGNWVYFKAVLKVDYASAFVGVGWGRFEVNGTINEDGDFVDSNGNVVDPSASRTVSISYANGYRSTYQFPAGSFTSDYLLNKSFNYTFDNPTNYGDKGSLVAIKGFTPWSGNPIDLMFDDNDTNYVHNAKGAAYDITPQNPFDLTVDLGKEIVATTMTMYGQPGKTYLPTRYTLYVGNSLEDLHEVHVKDDKISDNNLVVTFEEETFRYYRFVCTETQAYNSTAGTRYIAFRCIKFSYPFRLSNGKQIAADNQAIGFWGNWATNYCTSSFGRVLTGQKGSVAQFTFTGKLFAILSLPTETQGKLTVYVDGVKMDSQRAGLNSQNKGMLYLSEILSEGEHTVRIICEEAISIDSILIW